MAKIIYILIISLLMLTTVSCRVIDRNKFQEIQEQQQKHDELCKEDQIAEQEKQLPNTSTENKEDAIINSKREVLTVYDVTNDVQMKEMLNYIKGKQGYDVSYPEMNTHFYQNHGLLVAIKNAQSQDISYEIDLVNCEALSEVKCSNIQIGLPGKIEVKAGEALLVDIPLKRINSIQDTYLLVISVKNLITNENVINSIMVN